MSLDLLFAPSMRVSGEILHGEVELRFPQVSEDGIEEVVVRLKGWILTRVSRQFGTQQFIHQERQKILNEFLTVWTKGTLYPTPGSDTLRLPFQFQLPVDIPPSFQFNANYKHGIVGYYIDVVGVRKGAFSSNRRIYKPFAVVRHDPASASIRAALQNGWTGDWDVTERVAKIRRGLWGEHADVRMEILLPKVESFPLFTRIPFKIRVITITKEMKYEQKDGNEGEKVFPVPPLHPREIEMVLRCHVYITATGWSSTDSATVAPIGGMGRAAPQNGVGSDVVHTYEKKWVPHNTDKQTGSWRQETEMQSRFELKWSPSFSTRNLTQRPGTLQHTLRLKVSFPGIGNNLEADVPIRITSGRVTPTEAEAPPYDGPPPALDLPPTYWAATDWDHQDEKADANGALQASGSDQKS